MSARFVGYSGGAFELGTTGQPKVKPIKISSIKDPVAVLEPETRDKVMELERKLAEQGIALLKGRSRSTVSQEQKYAAEGKSALVKGITWHLLGRAIDVYPIDPATGHPDMMAKNIGLYRALHREWAKLGGVGLAFFPYPEGPIRKMRIPGPGGRTFVDLGHIEWHGPYPNLASAYNAEKAQLSMYV